MSRCPPARMSKWCSSAHWYCRRARSSSHAACNLAGLGATRDAVLATRNSPAATRHAQLARERVLHYTETVAVRTIFSMVEDCAAGERLGWYEFVRDYAPIARRLLNHYFPMLAPELDSQIVQLFQRARVADNAWFQQLRFSNEREFLMGFRDFLFAYGREVARVPTPEISLDQLRTIMSELPLVEREMLWMFVKGYDPETAAAMMSNTEATARATRKIADDRLAKILPEATAGAFNVSARVLIAEAEKTGGDECASLKT